LPQPGAMISFLNLNWMSLLKNDYIR